MTVITRIFCLFLVSLILAHCKKGADPSPGASALPAIISLVLNKGAVSTLIEENRRIIIEIPDDVDRHQLTAVFQLTPGTTATVNGVLQESSKTVNDFSMPLTYVLSRNGKTAIWTIEPRSNAKHIGFAGQTGRQNRLPLNNEFYVSQDSSGNLSSINGGPACLAMALKWADFLRFAVASPAELRTETGRYDRLRPIDLCNYMDKALVRWRILPIGTAARDLPFARCVDNGFLSIICLDFSKIDYNEIENEHIGRFWPITQREAKKNVHFIAIKGYKEMDGVVFYEAYDPFSNNERYSYNGESKGRNRYYRASAILAAAKSQQGWPYVLAVAKRDSALNMRLENELSRKQAGEVLENTSVVSGF